jgi:AraC family transcriptional regulator
VEISQNQRINTKSVTDAFAYPPRIEVFEDGRRVPIVSRVPEVAHCAFSGEDTVLEKHSVPQSMEYRDRELTTHIVMLYDGAPVRVECRMEGRRYDAQMHSGHVWIMPCHSHVAAWVHERHAAVLLSIGPSQFEHHIGPIMRGGRIELGAGFNVNDSQTECLLRGLMAEARNGSQADKLFSDLLVNAACVRLAKRYAVSKLNVVRPRGGLPMARLKRVLEYIDANLERSITLSGLAGTVDMSLYYFATLFKQSVGLSPHRYVVQQRVQRAKELLCDPKLSVLEVSISLGFGHPNNFARTFRRTVGISPSQFRRDRL